MTLDRVLVLFIGGALVAALSGLACGAKLDVHETQEAKSNDCVHCHTSAYQAAVNPKHEGVFDQTCDDCHVSKKAWAPIPEFHELDAIAQKECVSCHQKEYDATKKPPHAERHFPTDCKDCHDTEKYAPLPKDIHATQTFGKQDCYSCHQSNYENTTKPNHKQANIPTTCAGCHNAGGAWLPTKGGG